MENLLKSLNNFNNSREFLMQDFIDQYELYPDNFSPIYPSSYDSVSFSPTDNDDPNEVMLTGETKIEYLGNIKVWELASAFLFVSVFLLFVFFYVIKKCKSNSFDANEYTIMEKTLLNENKSTKIPTLVSARLLTYQTDTISSKSSSIISSNNNEKSNDEVVLSVDQLAYINKCLILDDEELDMCKVQKSNIKNDSIV